MSRAKPRGGEMTLSGLLRILFRWKRIGLGTFGLLFGVSALWALFGPLKYESQVLVERKPIRITPDARRLQDERFDVDRLTYDQSARPFAGRGGPPRRTSGAALRPVG